MNQTAHPSKELVREWLKQQIGQHRPPPSTSEIRAQLGWCKTQEEVKLVQH